MDNMSFQIYSSVFLVFLAKLTLSANIPTCDYHSDEQSYVCKYITTAFPSTSYGNYNLRCVDCDIKIFSSETFTSDNSLLSVNVSISGVEYVTSGAFSKFGNAQYLYLENNKIKNVSENAFAGLRQVYVLQLDANDIKELVPGFLNDFEVNTVSLGKNKIQELPNNVFAGALTLLNLNLENNSIKQLHYDSFSGLDTLEYLALQNNLICHLPLGVFKDMKTLRLLNLDNNKLSRFTLGTFSGLKDLSTLRLARNKIQLFEGTELLPLYRLTTLDLSYNLIYYLDSHNLFSSAPSLKFFLIEDNIFSCPHLVNIIQYFKGKGVEIISTLGRYDVQNINGIACMEEVVLGATSTSDFLKKVGEEIKNIPVAYC